jgi:imidazolonepropionase-like amidohydrolase
MKRSMLAAAVAALLTASGALAQDSAQGTALVLQGGTLIDGTGRAPITDAVIVVENGRIRAVGRRGEVTLPPGARVIDATERTILPGLVDMHLHLRGWKIPLYLAYGVTTTGDIHNDTQWILGERALLKSGYMKGPRLFVSGARVDGPNGPRLVDDAGKIVEDPSYVKTPEEARAYVRYLHTLGVDFIKVDFSLTDEQLAAVIDEASKYRLPVIGHINNIDTAMSYGMKEIEHLIGVFRAEYIREGKPVPTDNRALNSGVGLDPEKFGPLVHKMVDQGVALDIALYDWVRPEIWASVKPDVQRLADDPGTAFVPADEKALWLSDPKRQEGGYRMTVAFLKQFAAAGGHFTIDTDGNQKTDIVAGLGTHIIMQGVANMGIPAMQIIQATTLWPAQVMGVDKDYGSVEPGKAADFLIIQGDPLVDIKATRNIKMVIMDGKVVDTKFDPNFVNPLPRPLSDMQP